MNDLDWKRKFLLKKKIQKAYATMPDMEEKAEDQVSGYSEKKDKLPENFYKVVGKLINFIDKAEEDI
ncbi:hypothetical protein IZY60_05380 [Lutibacter sp. B2]|nr:hypothetical protein [Lutibacter sp. B2]